MTKLARIAGRCLLIGSAMAVAASFHPATMRSAAAQGAPTQNAAPMEPPELLLAVPFAVTYASPTPEASAAPGKPPEQSPGTVKVVLRGLRLDNPTEVRVGSATGTAVTGPPVTGVAGSARILSSGPAAVPDKLEAKRVGDRQVEIALTMPSVPPVNGRLELRVVTAAGVSQPYWIGVDVGGKSTEEIEPNDGFGTAQALELAQGVALKLDGGIHEPRNVDVFRFEGRAGERLRGELIAARQGGPLDAFATLFDEAGNIVFQADDADRAADVASRNGAPVGTAAANGSEYPAASAVNSGADPRWDVVLPLTGRYYLALQDAHDRGGVLHRYRLVLERR
ncbi:MAG: hypothetical protein ACKO38_14525 [Planctomycetota bacterium]